jgi:hypothetical protein
MKTIKLNSVQAESNVALRLYGIDLNVERKTKIKMNIEINKPRWKNKEWTFNILPYLSVTKISNLVIAINVGWLFWGITICNDF